MIETAIKLLETLLYNKDIKFSSARDDNIVALQKSHGLKPETRGPTPFVVTKTNTKTVATP